MSSDDIEVAIGVDHGRLLEVSDSRDRHELTSGEELPEQVRMALVASTGVTG